MSRAEQLDLLQQKMNVDLKERWISALLSGEYKQGRAALQRNGCNCCLGVLARIQDTPFTEDDPQYREGNVFNFGQYHPFTDKAYTSAIMPPGGWSDITYGQQQTLADMNDKGKSFAEIAEWIKENL